MVACHSLLNTHYEQGERLGSGAYGTVYLARDVRDGSRCCVKQVCVTDASDKELARAEMEVGLLSTLGRHPGIVGFRDCFATASSYCIVMDYCAGGDLAQVVKTQRDRNELLPEETVLDWLIQLALALEFVHKHRVLHRDLKLHNVFLDEHGHARLGDFGIAKAMESLTGAASCVGTPHYMAPEVVQGETYSYAADVWSLGCILHELCTLSKAFHGTNFLAVVYAICKKEPPLLPDIYSDELRELAWAMMAKDPCARPTLDEILRSPLVSSRLAASPPWYEGYADSNADSDADSYAECDTEADGADVEEVLVAADGASDRGGDDGVEDVEAPDEAAGVHGRMSELVRRPMAQVSELLRRVGKASAQHAAQVLHLQQQVGQQVQMQLSTSPLRKWPQRRCTASRYTSAPMAMSEEVLSRAGDRAADPMADPMAPRPEATPAGAPEAATAAVGTDRLEGGCDAAWYYLDEQGVQCGPVDDEMLLLLHVLGDIEDATRVWREGMERWEAIRRAVPSLLLEAAAAGMSHEPQIRC